MMTNFVFNNTLVNSNTFVNDCNGSSIHSAEIDIYGTDTGSGAFSNNSFKRLSGINQFHNQPTCFTYPNNADTSNPIVAEPSFNYSSDTQTFSLTNNDSNATLRYTTDGSVPTASSPVYTGGNISVTKSEVVNCKAFRSGYLPSDTSCNLIDLLTVPVSNSSFETPATSTYVYGPMTNGWAFVSTTGVEHNGSAWGASAAPEGFQAAFLAGTSNFSQSITFAPGTWQVNFKAAKRTVFGSTETFEVLFDNSVIGTYTPSSGSFVNFSTNAFTATAGSHTIEFLGLVNDDATDFIDCVSITAVGAPTAYYVSYINGDDNNSGTQSYPWKTLAKVSSVTFQPGDTIYLERGDVFNQPLILHGSGISTSPITLSSYGTDPSNPVICLDSSTGSKCILLPHINYWNINGLELCNAQQGIYCDYSGAEANMGNLNITNCYFHGIALPTYSSTTDTDLWGEGVAFNIEVINQSNKNAVNGQLKIQNVTIKNCYAANCDSFSGMFLDSYNAINDAQNIVVNGCTATHCAYNVFNMTDGRSGVILKNSLGTFNGGIKSAPFGTTDVIMNGYGTVIQNDEFNNHLRYSDDPDGCGVDFEINNNGNSVKNCFINNCAGAGVLFCYASQSGNLADNCTFYLNSQNPGSEGGQIDFVGLQTSATVSNNVFYPYGTLPSINGNTTNVTISNNTTGTLSQVYSPTISLSPG